MTKIIFKAIMIYDIRIWPQKFVVFREQIVFRDDEIIVEKCLSTNLLCVDALSLDIIEWL